MIDDIKKESKRVLASSLYNPSIHGNKFRQAVADEIIEQHIVNIDINKIPSENNVIVNAKVKGNVLATDNRCMDFYNAKITRNKDGVYSQDKKSISSKPHIPESSESEIIGNLKSKMKKDNDYSYHCFKIGAKFKGDASDLVGRFHRASRGIIYVSSVEKIHNNQKYITVLLDTHAESQEDHPKYEQ